MSISGDEGAGACAKSAAGVSSSATISSRIEKYFAFIHAPKFRRFDGLPSSKTFGNSLSQDTPQHPAQGRVRGANLDAESSDLQSRLSRRGSGLFRHRRPLADPQP